MNNKGICIVLDKCEKDLSVGMPAAVFNGSEIIESSVCKVSVDRTLALALALADIAVLEDFATAVA